METRSNVQVLDVVSKRSEKITFIGQTVYCPYFLLYLSLYFQILKMLAVCIYSPRNSPIAEADQSSL